MVSIIPLTFRNYYHSAANAKGQRGESKHVDDVGVQTVFTCQAELLKTLCLQVVVVKLILAVELKWIAWITSAVMLGGQRSVWYHCAAHKGRLCQCVRYNIILI